MKAVVPEDPATQVRSSIAWILIRKAGSQAQPQTYKIRIPR